MKGKEATGSNKIKEKVSTKIPPIVVVELAENLREMQNHKTKFVTNDFLVKTNALRSGNSSPGAIQVSTKQTFAEICKFGEWSRQFMQYNDQSNGVQPRVLRSLSRALTL